MQDVNVMDKERIFEITFRVRWNEMDANGHVNNMIYQSYFDEGRADMLIKAGMDINRMIKDGIGPIIYHAEFDYLRELKHPDEAIVHTWIESWNIDKAVIQQELIRKSDYKIVCKAKVYGMLFNFSKRKPEPVPDNILKKLGIN